jgi:hypothetical protein
MKEIQLQVDGNDFLLSMEEGAVILHNSESLENLLQKNSYDNAMQLANKIQSAYEANFSRVLNISEASIAVEILGHVYFENFMETIGNKIPIKMVDTICENIRSRCAEINIGEKDRDHNRVFWDLVTPVVKKYFN